MMLNMSRRFHAFGVLLVSFALAACGDDDGGGSPAQRMGVGSECTADSQCPVVDGVPLKCLAFKGGYCGIADCTADVDCPGGSACVTEQGANYCFLICTDKPQCNYTRSLANESNCSSSVDFVEGKTGVKACLPPSG